MYIMYWRGFVPPWGFALVGMVGRPAGVTENTL
jgi:hypothetical protein